MIIKKIIYFDELSKFTKKNKNKKIIHCHGVFDIVHPGHIRHLSYCKNRADILVVSITADKFIKKGIYRPLIPEKIRANNLAALEVVDYVIIDKFKYPHNLIKKLKPNFFAKGNEYQNLSNPLTQKENDILKSFGGKMIFTPGDIIFSSTKIINESKIDLKYEKLKSLIEESNYSLEKILKLTSKFKKIKIHVLGDLIVDTIHECEAVAGLHKTPTLSLIKKNSNSYLGGAGIVAAHFASFSNNVTLTTVLGKDTIGNFAKKMIKKYKIKLNAIYALDRTTTEKSIFTSKGHNLLKVNNVNNDPINEQNLDSIISKIKKTKCDIFVIADYRHGIFNKDSCQKIVKSIRRKSFKVADSQVASRWGNILDFKFFDLITPTEQEARYSLFEQDLTIRALADKLLKLSKSKNIILKIGERGLIALGKNNPDYITLDPFVDKVVDTNGAGDALLAYSSATLFKEKSILAASIMGLIAASCKCEKNGNLPISQDEIRHKIQSIKKHISYEN